MRVFLGLFASCAVAQQAVQQEYHSSPVSKVVKLLNDMKATVEKEYKADADLFEKMECWCKTNRAEKSAAVEAAKQKIEHLTAKIEGLIATSARLESEIKQLKKDIASNQESLSTATALRNKEHEAFVNDERELNETIASLTKAVAALSKAHGGSLAQTSVHAVLVQLGNKVKGAPSRFQDVMRSDLWGVLSDFAASPSAKTADNSALVEEAFLGKKEPVMLAQQPTGAAAGAKSYNSKSGEIYGVLQQMEEDFKKQLDTTVAEENTAQEAFNAMKEALLKEIAAQKASVTSKQAELGDAKMQTANSKKELESTKDALSADEQFQVELEKKCKESDESFQARQKARTEEIAAVGKAIEVLTEDESRTLFSRSFSGSQSFVQIRSVARSEHRMRDRAAARILAAAKKTKSYHLAALAVSVRLDAFVKVKKAMDDMLAELKKQQKNEYEKREFCVSSLTENEDQIGDKNKLLADTNATIEDLQSQIASLKKEIEVLELQVTASQQSIKAAGEDRAKENAEFQATVKDQKLTVNILQKALASLEGYYNKSENAAVSSSAAVALAQNTPGKASAPPPPTAKAYKTAGASAPVMELLRTVIADAESTAAECTRDEQVAQASYEEFVTSSNKSIAAAQNQIADNQGVQAKNEAELSDNEATKADTEKILSSLAAEKADLHAQCDFVVKNYAVTQEARQQEMEAIAQAKAVLSGADFQ
jgi:chromosome segregation ATPase